MAENDSRNKQVCWFHISPQCKLTKSRQEVTRATSWHLVYWTPVVWLHEWNDSETKLTHVSEVIFWQWMYLSESKIIPTWLWTVYYGQLIIGSDFKGALCSFVEATLIRKDQSSLTDFFSAWNQLNKQTLCFHVWINWINKLTLKDNTYVIMFYFFDMLISLYTSAQNYVHI